MPLAVILAVGLDPALLGTRSLVLRSAGYTVVPATSVKEAADRFQAHEFDLVLLCHSIPAKERIRLTHLIRMSGSSTPIVSIAGNLGDCDAFANATLEDGPRKFLAGIQRSLLKVENIPAASAVKSGEKMG